MIRGIKDEMIDIIKNILINYNIFTCIDENYREELTEKQLNELKYPICLFNITNIKYSDIDANIENDYFIYNPSFQLILTLESRELDDSFDDLFLFLCNRQETRNYLDSKKKEKCKIFNLEKLYEHSYYLNNKIYHKKVIELTYEKEIHKEVKKEWL